MFAGRNTKRIISIAEKPGTFGVDFHNRGYAFFDLDYTYMPLKVVPWQLEAVVQLVRDNFRGCSVSMPHKIEVMKYLDFIDDVAQNVGSVNTIVNEQGKLRACNTDVFSAQRTLGQLDLKNKKVVMAGAGGMALAIGYAVQQAGGELIVTNRDEAKARLLAEKYNATYIPFAELKNADGYLFINATSVGMNENDARIVDDKTLSRFDAVMDVVVRETELIRAAQALGKKVVRGKEITVYQAAEQFKIYTGRELPENFLREFLI